MPLESFGDSCGSSCFQKGSFDPFDVVTEGMGQSALFEMVLFYVSLKGARLLPSLFVLVKINGIWDLLKKTQKNSKGLLTT